MLGNDQFDMISAPSGIDHKAYYPERLLARTIACSKFTATYLFSDMCKFQRHIGIIAWRHGKQEGPSTPTYI